MTDHGHTEQTDRTSWWQCMRGTSASEADRRNQLWFKAWMTAWGISFVGATWVLRSANAGSPTGSTAWIVALVPTGLAIIAVVAFMRFLRQTDELIRRIQLEALVFGFVTAILFGVASPLLARAGAPELGVNGLAAIAMLAFGIGQLVGTRRYR
ncbi:hypothetical protein BH23ACT10_BH23ACT10_23930 [soil metagenome]